MKTNRFPGKFIVIEGLDGAGHSTQAKLLGQFLEKMGKKVILTHEPTLISEAGRLIDRILHEKEKSSPENLQKLFAQDRKEYLQRRVIPALRRGEFVISDRYFFSSFAYGVSEGLGLEWLIRLNNEFLSPDLSFVLKVSPATCLKRIHKRRMPKTLFEKRDKLVNVWKTYAVLPEIFEGVIMINGEQSVKQISQEIKALVLSQFFQTDQFRR